MSLTVFIEQHHRYDMLHRLIFFGFICCMFSFCKATIAEEDSIVTKAISVIASGSGRVLLQVNANHSEGPKNIRIVAATVEGGGFTASYPKLYDDGTHGDRQANDGIYSLTVSPMGLPGERTVTYYVVDTSGAEVVTEPSTFILR